MTVFVTNELAGLLAGPVAAVSRRAGLPWPDRRPVPLVPCREERHGEVSSPAALRIAASLRARREAPREIAEAILGALPAAGTLLERAEVAGPGYLNFTVRRERWLADLEAILSDAEPGGREPETAAPARGPAGAIAALARIAGVFRARAAAGAPGRPAPADLSRLRLPSERSLVRRVVLLPRVAASCEGGEDGLHSRLEELAAAFRDYDGGVRLVSRDGGLTRARLALVAAVGRTLRAGLALLGAQRRGAP